MIEKTHTDKLANNHRQGTLPEQGLPLDATNKVVNIPNLALIWHGPTLPLWHCGRGRGLRVAPTITPVGSQLLWVGDGLSS